MKQYNRVCAYIDLDAVEYNIEMMKKNLKEGVRMLAVVKMDGYGHGAVPIAKMLEEKDYIWGYAVATADEALTLCKYGVKKPVLVLGCVFPDQRDALIAQGVRMTVYTKEMAEDLAERAKAIGKDAYIHVKLDTGMSRIGFLPGKESVEEIREIKGLPGLIAEGMYTHFARADETDKTYTQEQIERYLYMKRALEERGASFTYYHCSNSAAIIDIKEANMDLVRAGISTYGLYPSEEVKKADVPLKPAMALISHVAHVKWVEAGTPVSYGGTHITDRRTKIVTIPVGYGDGYPRSLSNKGYVLIHGKRAPILGRVCMDQLMVDGSSIEDVRFGDKVTLIGKDGEESLPVEVLSGLSERFSYEFICSIGKRVPRTYLRHGEIVGQTDFFS